MCLRPPAMDSVNKVLTFSVLKRVIFEKFFGMPKVVNVLFKKGENLEFTYHLHWHNLDVEFTTLEDLCGFLSQKRFGHTEYLGLLLLGKDLDVDLDSLVLNVLEALPRINSIAINKVSADSEPQIYMGLKNTCDYCKKKSISLYLHLPAEPFLNSLDGLKKQVNFVEKSGIFLSLRCNITKENLFQVDELLDYCLEEDLYCQFQIGSADSQNAEPYFENEPGFNELETYQLGLFFIRLINSYLNSKIIRRTYHKYLAFYPRLFDIFLHAGGQYLPQAIRLDQAGQLIIFSPKECYADVLDLSRNPLREEIQKTKQKIIQDNCLNFLFDFEAPQNGEERSIKIGKIVTPEPHSLEEIMDGLESHRPGRIARNRVFDYLITGWYGTETAGDKAILGEILHELRANDRECKIGVTSLYPFITYQTLKELGFEGVEVIAVSDPKLRDYFSSSGTVIIGGGPLLHIDTLWLLIMGFQLAKEAGNSTKIWGCGIGPLFKGPKYYAAVKKIVELADEVYLRDTQSWTIAREMTNRSDLKIIDDPAINYAKRWLEENPPRENKNQVAVLIRDFPHEFWANETHTEIRLLKEKFLEGVACLIRQVLDETHCSTVNLLSMHHFYVGDDDRIVNRHLRQTYLQGLDVICSPRPMRVEFLFHEIQSSKYCICMRYHSVIFSNILNGMFTAIDYTNGGKVYSYLKDVDKSNQLLSMEDIIKREFHPYAR